jgi:YggT family protein
MLTPPPLLVNILWSIANYGIIALIVAIIIRVIASWINIDERVPFILFLARLSDPFIVPCRRLIGRVGVLDLSYLIAIFLLLTLRTLLGQALLG